MRLLTGMHLFTETSSNTYKALPLARALVPGSPSAASAIHM